MTNFEFLQSITSCSRGNESTISFMRKLDSALTEEVWTGLPTETKMWFNETILSIARIKI